MLVLTNNRLICVKLEKGGRVLAIRGEWAIPKVAIGKERPNHERPKPDKEKKKGKDSANQAIMSVDPKGDKEFVVLTVRQTSFLKANGNSSCILQATKSVSFATEDSALRSNWVSNIQRALDLTTASSAAA